MNHIYSFLAVLKKYSHFILGIAFLLLFSMAYFLGGFSPLKATIGILIGIINIGYGLYVQQKSRMNHDAPTSTSTSL